MYQKSVAISHPPWRNVDSVLRHQPQPVQLAGVLRPGGQEIDACGFDAGMPQHVGQPGDVLARLVKRGGKQVAQVVGEHLGWLHPGIFAQAL